MMAIHIHHRYVESVSEDNDTFVMSGAPHGVAAFVLIGSSLDEPRPYSSTEFKELRRALLRKLFNVLDISFPEASLWVSIQVYYPQDNRVSREARVWRHLERNGILIPENNRLSEYVMPPHRHLPGIRFRTAFKATEDSIEEPIQLQHSGSSFVIFTNQLSNVKVANILQIAWQNGPSDETIHRHLMSLAVDQQMLLANFNGHVDEPELYLTVLGPSDVIGQLRGTDV